jgi:hypothetical protein
MVIAKRITEPIEIDQLKVQRAGTLLKLERVFRVAAAE